jgi:hypothetical protein
MLIKADLRILDSLHSHQSITGLSTVTDYSPGYISERVAHLEAYDLVTTTQEYHTKQVRALPTPVFDSYRELTADSPHIDFPSLISPSMLRICWFLDTPIAVSDIEPRLNVRRRRIYQLLKNLQSRGLITNNNNNRYALPDGHTGLADFAQTVIKYEHQHHVRTLIPTATVVWSAPHEMLITTGEMDDETVMATFEERDNYSSTGLSRFDDYGLEFFIAGPPPYFYSELRDTLAPEDFISHTLMLETDVRNLSYCALLILATDVSADELYTAATRYDIEDTIHALISFIKTNGETEQEDIRLPEWSEMKSLTAQYGVTV